jgi:hypothetical protein
MACLSALKPWQRKSSDFIGEATPVELTRSLTRIAVGLLVSSYSVRGETPTMISTAPVRRTVVMSR